MFRRTNYKKQADRPNKLFGKHEAKHFRKGIGMPYVSHVASLATPGIRIQMHPILHAY